MVYLTNTSACLKTLILVKKSEFQRIQTQINKDAIVGWQNAIDIQPINDQRLSHPDFNKLREKNTEDIISKYDNESFGELIVQIYEQCNH